MEPLAPISFLNARFHRLTLAECVDTIYRMCDSGSRGWVSTVNVAILMTMRRDARLQGFVDKAALVVADGKPIVWCSRLFGSPLPERVAGIDLIDALCERAATEGRRVYLLGARREAVERAAERLQDRHPGLSIDWSDGYFSIDETQFRVRQINDCNAAILLVGMGVPRQEQFIEENWAALRVGVAIAVGGSFDVIAAVRKRAPMWVQKIGMEWFFRLAQEPRRLFVRYLTTNIQFALVVVRELIRKRRP
jgi:N-acetylglucosaminyldiphosphoundecaprenol N-acetyl-beta-D-mannosaminyltransferase